MSKGKGNAPTLNVVQKELNVSRPSGFQLKGTLSYREDQTPVGPVLIFLHGTMSSADHNFVPDLASKLSKEMGIRTYRFDFRFSQNEFEPQHRYKFSGYADDVDDLNAVIRSLSMDGFLVWGLIGHSRGSNDALIYARDISRQSLCSAKPRSFHHAPSSSSVIDLVIETDLVAIEESVKAESGMYPDPRRFCVVACAPRFNMPNMLTTLFNAEQISLIESTGSCPWESHRGELVVTKEDANIVLHELNMHSVCDEIAPEIPILLLQGTDDELIPASDADCYKAARPSVDVTIVDGARHAFRGKKQNKVLLSTISEWLQIRYKMFFPEGDPSLAITSKPALIDRPK